MLCLAEGAPPAFPETTIDEITSYSATVRFDGQPPLTVQGREFVGYSITLSADGTAPIRMIIGAAPDASYRFLGLDESTTYAVVVDALVRTLSGVQQVVNLMRPPTTFTTGIYNATNALIKYIAQC